MYVWHDMQQHPGSSDLYITRRARSEDTRYIVAGVSEDVAIVLRSAASCCFKENSRSNSPNKPATTPPTDSILSGACHSSMDEFYHTQRANSIFHKTSSGKGLRRPNQTHLGPCSSRPAAVAECSGELPVHLVLRDSQIPESRSLLRRSCRACVDERVKMRIVCLRTRYRAPSDA